MSNHYKNSGPMVLLSRLVYKYKIDITEAEGKKKLCRYKITENWHVVTEIRPESNAAKIISIIPKKIIEQTVFTQVTKEELNNNATLATMLPNFDPSISKCFYAEISGKLYVLLEKDLKKQVSRTLKNSKSVLHKVYEMEEIPVTEIENKRKSNIPGFILKDDGKYFYTEVPPKIGFNLEITTGHHMCSFGNDDCNRLSPDTDERGGCAKVRDQYKRIEKYHFIISGFETINTRQRSFVVLKCNNYEKRLPREPRSKNEVQSLKLQLANLYFDDDIQSYAEVRERKFRNNENFS